ncbi:MAG: outer membrane beta-barrel protein [bacterium]
MIRKSFLAFLFIFTLFIFSSVCVADEGDFSFGAVVGGVGLTGANMSQYGSNGFGYGGYMTYSPSSLFDMDINLVYSPHSNLSNQANSLYGTVALRTGISYDKLYPFLTAGVGVYRNSVELFGGSDSIATFGFNVGAGMDIDLGQRIKIGLLVRYHPVFDRNVRAGFNGVSDMWDAMLRIGMLFKTSTQGGWD